MTLSRSSVADPSRPLLALLRAGFRVVRIECQPPSRTAAGAAAASRMGKAIVADVVAGLDQYVAANHGSAGPDGGRRAAPRIGIMGSGLSGLLALNAVGWSDRFAAAVCQGAPASERWVHLERGEGTPRSLPTSDGGGPADKSGAPAAEATGEDATAAAAATPPVGTAAEAGRRAEDVRAASAAASQHAASEYELLGALAASRTPTLLLYGDRDPACPLSQAHVVFHALTGSEGTRAQLVLYRGEAARLVDPTHQRDANRRVAGWFAQHLR